MIEIQLEQLISVLVYACMGIAFWKIDNKYVRIAIVSIAFILFVANPIKHKQQGGAKLEKGITRFDDIPDKVVVEEKDYSKEQAEVLNKLKKQSEEVEYEIHK